MTSLIEQLQKLALPDCSFHVTDDRQRESILFEGRYAATLQKDVVYAIGLNGFQELCAIDPKFRLLYYEALFSEVSVSTDRSINSKGFNRKLDKTINSFLVHLSPYFQLKPAQKCLEWLIYRFRIHTFNVDAVMRCILPYWNTNLFSRFVQLLDIKESKSQWSWLHNVSDADRSNLKAVLHTKCRRSSFFLQFVCDMVQTFVRLHSIEEAWLCRQILNFFTSMILAIVNNHDDISEIHLLHLMPVILKGLKSSVVDYQASSFMIVASLSMKMMFETKVLKAIIDSSIKHCNEVLQSELLKMLCLLCQTQENLNTISNKSCKLLSMMTKLQETVTQQASYANMDDFLKIYFTCILSSVFTDSAHDDGTAIKCGNALKTIIENSHLTVSVQKHIFRLLISCYKSNRQQVPLGIIKEVLVQMQQKYIDTFNEALSETKDDSDNVFNSLLISLSSVESQVHIEYGIALSHGLMHADCSIWSQALYRMHSLILNEQGDEEAQSFVLQTVEGILKYDVIKPDVILETLKLLSLCKQGILMKAASQIRQNLMKLIETHMSDEVWHNTVQLAIQCLTNHTHGTKQDCTDFCEKNQVTNFLVKLLLRNLVCDANHGVKCLTIVFAKSEFVKEHIFLNELILTMSQSDSEGDTMSKILTALADIIKKKELYNDVVELLRALSTDYNNLSDLSLHFFWIAVSWHVGSNCPNIFFMGCKLLYSATTYFQKTLQGTIHLEHIDCDINSLLSHMFDHTMKSVTSQHFFLLICKAWHQIITAAAKFKKHFTSNEIFIPCTSLSMDCISDNPCLISMDKWAASIVAHLLHMSGQISFSDETAIQVVNNTLFHLFDCMIRGVDDLLQFLSYILQQVLLSDKYDSLVCVSVLYLACNIIRLTGDISENESKIMLQTSNSIIPAVMIACTSTKYGIRKAAVVTIQAMASLNEFSLVDLFQFLDKFSNEILVDAGHCSSVIAEYFSWEKREETTSKLLNELFLKHVVPSHKMNINLRANLYDKCFSQIDNILELQIMLPTIETFLKTLKTNPESFDESSCTMLKQFLRKVSSSLKVDSKYLQILLFFLRLDGIEIAERKVHQIFFDLQGFTIGLINNKFFKPLPDQVKQIILHELISINTTTPSTIVGAGSVKAFKSLTLDSSLVVCELLSKAEMVVNPTTTLSNTITAKFLSTQTAISSSDTEKSWKELTVLLELLHHKKRITKLHKLVGPLFQILEEITNISYDSHDYIILLILGCLLNVFKRITYGDPHVKTEIRNAVKVEFLIKCIHSSDNTNIHQLALLLILEAVSICPEKVLHSVMSIFTFMGNILMRKDDSYSFQVMTHIIRIIVPRLISMRENTEEGRQNNDAVLDILQVFVDAWLHVPSHRRLAIIKELLTAIGPCDYLWKFLILLADRHLCNAYGIHQEYKDETSLEDSAQFFDQASDNLMCLCVSICALFDIEVQLKTVTDIIIYLSSLDGGTEPSENENIINTTQRSSNHLHRLYLMLLTLSIQLLSKSKKTTTSDDKAEVIPLTKRVLRHSLFYLSQTTLIAQQTNSNVVSVRYKKCLIQKLNELVNKVVKLFSPKSFLLTVRTFLVDENILSDGFCMEKILQLCNSCLSHAYFNEKDYKILLQLSDLLVNIIQRRSKILAGSSLQSATLSLSHIIKMCGKLFPDHFIVVVPILCDIAQDDHVSNNAKGMVIACIGEICLKLKAHCIAHLSRICRCFIGLLHHWSANINSLLVDIFAALQKLIICLGHFLSPYLVEFITKLSVIHYTVKRTIDTDESVKVSCQTPKRMKKSHNSNSTSLYQAVLSVLDVIASSIAIRVLLPTFQLSLEKLFEESPLAVTPILLLINGLVMKLEKTDLTRNAYSILSTFLYAMDFRTKNCKLPISDVEGIEEIVLQGVISLLIKIPEETFSSLYMKLCDWGCAPDTMPPRLTTFYRCTAMLASKLKGLYEVFAHSLIDKIASTLEEKSATSYINGGNIYQSLYAVDTLHSMILYFSNTFINQERYELIMQPLVNQLEKSVNNEELERKYILNHVIPCIGQLAASAHDNVIWQPLNYNILMKMRHSSIKVRCYALDCLQMVGERLGENYLILLPESIPYLTELLEDGNEIVERRCQSVIKRLEEGLGEPLQKYF